MRSATRKCRYVRNKLDHGLTAAIEAAEAAGVSATDNAPSIALPVLSLPGRRDRVDSSPCGNDNINNLHAKDQSRFRRDSEQYPRFPAAPAGRDA
jgi:hypothetical protein